MSKVHHGYAEVYASYLKPFVQRAEPVTLVEVGILKGTGLAIWSDLFDDGRIVGLDIDLKHTLANMDNLRAKGAFRSRNVELHQFDQLTSTAEDLQSIVGADCVDVMIDDGLHAADAIVRTAIAASSVLSREFVYFIEDNSTVHDVLRVRFPQWQVVSYGEMTVLLPERGCSRG